MTIPIILEVLLGLSACLALVALGGMVATLSRDARNSVSITVQTPGREQQIVRVKYGSPVLGQLRAVLSDVNFGPSQRTDDGKASEMSVAKRRRINIIGVLVGGGAAALGTLPFLAERTVVYLVLSLLGGGFFTRLGEFFPSAMSERRSPEWRTSSTEEKIKTLAALFVGEQIAAGHAPHGDGHDIHD